MSDITTAPEWRHALVHSEIEQASWLTPHMPVWIARLDPAFTRGDGWYLISYRGDHNLSIRVPARLLYGADVEFIEDEWPDSATLADLNHVWSKSCQYVYDRLLAKYGEED